MSSDKNLPAVGGDQAPQDPEDLHGNGNEAMGTVQRSAGSDSPGIWPKGSQHYIVYAGCFAAEVEADRTDHGTACDIEDLDCLDYNPSSSLNGNMEVGEGGTDVLSSEEEELQTTQSSIVAEAGSVSSTESSVDQSRPRLSNRTKRVAHYVFQHQKSRSPRAFVKNYPSGPSRGHTAPVDGLTRVRPHNVASNQRRPRPAQHASTSDSTADNGNRCRDDADETNQ